VVRSERLIKLGNSWFSAKSISVERLNYFLFGVKLSINDGNESFTEFTETLNTNFKRC
jgi:hypothetical protein